MAKTTKPPAIVSKTVPGKKRARKGVSGLEKFPKQFQHVCLSQRLKYARFVAEYVKDFNCKNAYLRTGFPTANAQQAGNHWLDQPIVQFMLDKVLREMQEEVLVDRRFILTGLKKEAMYHGIDGGSSARTTALRVLAKIFGMEKIVTENKHTVEGGVMTVPLVATPDWEEAAGSSQAKLKEVVRQ